MPIQPIWRLLCSIGQSPSFRSIVDQLRVPERDRHDHYETQTCCNRRQVASQSLGFVGKYNNHSMLTSKSLLMRFDIPSKPFTMKRPTVACWSPVLPYLSSSLMLSTIGLACKYLFQVIIIIQRGYCHSPAGNRLPCSACDRKRKQSWTMVDRTPWRLIGM